MREVLKHGTLTIGFIGLAECLKALIGQHHGESEAAQELGKRIIRHIRDRADEKMRETGLNFSVIATPAEGLSGRFVRLDQERFGVIPGVTDREPTPSIYRYISRSAPMTRFVWKHHITP